MVSFAVAKPCALPNRHILSLSLLLLLSITLLRNYPYDNPLRHISHFQTHPIFRKAPTDASSIPNAQNSDTWPKPAPLRQRIPFTKGSSLGDKLANHSWIQPMVIMTLARPLDSNHSCTEVFVYVTGVKMGTYQRKVSVVGCLIGDDVYKGSFEMGEVLVCDVPRRVEIGEHVSLVLRKDDALKRALRGESIAGMNVKIHNEDISQLGHSTTMHVTGSSNPADYVKIRSDASVEHVSPGLETIKEERMRYKVCMGTQMKTFPHLLPDWVSYHRKLGVDMVYVLDNDSKGDLTDLVGNFSGVEVVYWPFQKSQTQAMSYLLIALRERCEWVLLSDADEYVMIGMKDGKIGGIREYLDGISTDIEQVYIPYLTMGISGHVTMPTGRIPEEYLYKHTRQKQNGKVIARSDAAWLSSRIHVHRSRIKREIDRAAVSNETPSVGDAAVMVHFQKRSFEEVLMKREFGSGSVGDSQHSTNGRDVDMRKRNKGLGDVPLYYKEIRDNLRYTYFRDVWRLVEQLGDTRQVLVRSTSGSGQVRHVL